MAEVGHWDITQLSAIHQRYGGNFVFLTVIPIVLVIAPLHSTFYDRAVLLRALLLAQLELEAMHTSDEGGTRSQYAISLTAIVFFYAWFEMFLHGLVIQCVHTVTRISVISQGCVPPLIKYRNCSHRTTWNDTRHILRGCSLTLSMTCSSPRWTFFLHAISFECTSKLCITFLNQFSVYFHLKKRITQFSHWIVSCTIFFKNIAQLFIKITHSFVAIELLTFRKNAKNYFIAQESSWYFVRKQDWFFSFCVYKSVSQKNWFLFMSETYYEFHHWKTTRTFIYTESKRIAKRFHIQKSKHFSKS